MQCTGCVLRSSNNSDCYARLVPSCDSALIFDIKSFNELRANRLVGALVGIDKRTSSPAFPHCLSDEELNLVVHKRLITVTCTHSDSKTCCDLCFEAVVCKPSQSERYSRCLVFEDLWNRGYFLTSGAKFGATFLAYRGDPLIYHAALVVTVVAENTCLPVLKLVEIGRLATSVNKTAVIATLKNGEVKYMQLDWSNNKHSTTMYPIS